MTDRNNELAHKQSSLLGRHGKIRKPKKLPIRQYVRKLRHSFFWTFGARLSVRRQLSIMVCEHKGHDEHAGMCLRCGSDLAAEAL